MRVGRGLAGVGGERGRAACVASGGACGQKYFWGVRAYARARGANIFYFFIFLKSFQSCVLADGRRTEDGGGTLFSFA